MVPISVIILTYNEVDNIAKALKSVKNADEIILIDASTDDTVAIAKSIIPNTQLKIITSAVGDNFAYLRNAGLKEARNDWVFFLDADEEVPSALFAELEHISQKEKNDTHGYFVKRDDYFQGRRLTFGETRNIKMIKFGKKSAGIWTRRVHEVWQIEGKTETLKTPLKHFPHPTIAEFLERINRWTDIDAQVFYEQGTRYNAFHIVAFPVGKFLKNYFLKLGLLDGMPGFIMSFMMSFHSFLTRGKVYMLQIQAKKP